MTEAMRNGDLDDGGLASGTVIGGRFIVRRKLGGGGMGEVYLAENAEVNTKLYAVKVLRPEYSRNPRFAAMLLDEATKQAKLDHINVVGMYDYVRWADRCCLVQSYIKGSTLGQLLARQPGGLALDVALDMMMGVLQGLDYAHAAGILHCDIKPANVIVDGNGRPCVTDFGISRDIDEKSDSIGLAGAGTPEYMSPEQTTPPYRIDHRSDVFSAGVMFFELLCGQLPFREFSDKGEIYPQRAHDAPDVRRLRPQVPEAIARIVATALQRDPDVRFQSCGAFAQAIVDYRHRVEFRRKLRWMVPVAAVPVIAMAFTFHKWQEFTADQKALNAERMTFGESVAAFARKQQADAANFAREQLGLPIPAPAPVPPRTASTRPRNGSGNQGAAASQAIQGTLPVQANGSPSPGPNEGAMPGLASMTPGGGGLPGSVVVQVDGAVPTGSMYRDQANPDGSGNGNGNRNANQVAQALALAAAAALDRQPGAAPQAGQAFGQTGAMASHPQVPTGVPGNRGAQGAASPIAPPKQQNTGAVNQQAAAAGNQQTTATGNQHSTLPNSPNSAVQGAAPAQPPHASAPHQASAPAQAPRASAVTPIPRASAAAPGQQTNAALLAEQNRRAQAEADAAKKHQQELQRQSADAARKQQDARQAQDAAAARRRQEQQQEAANQARAAQAANEAARRQQQQQEAANQARAAQVAAAEAARRQQEAAQQRAAQMAAQMAAQEQAQRQAAARAAAAAAWGQQQQRLLQQQQALNQMLARTQPNSPQQRQLMQQLQAVNQMLARGPQQ